MKNLRRNVLISLLVCLAFVFRLSFISFFSTPSQTNFAGGSSLKAISFHKGKKRRRMLYQLSKAETSFATRAQKAVAVIRSRAASFLLSFALPLSFLPGRNNPGSSLFTRTRAPAFAPGSLRKHLSLSILRV